MLKNSKSPMRQDVLISLVSYVYKQSNLGMAASLFCAFIVFVSLYSQQKPNAVLFIWFGFYLLVTFSRIVMTNFFFQEKNLEKNIRLWSNLYTFGAILGGISWGLAGVILFPNSMPEEQTLLVLMLAGVTAGSMPLSAPIPKAAIAFLILSIFPFIVSIALLKNYIYLLFDMALTLYLFYSIILSLRLYHLVKNSIFLRFENDELLKHLSKTKDALEITNLKLEHAATHDPLTQMANRSLFEQNLQDVIKRAQLNKKIVALFYIDLDGFKEINDVYGHHIGDLLLMTLTERLRNFLNVNDMIARIGGDEFTIILENINDIAEVENYAKNICRLLAKPCKILELELRLSGSVGISLYPDDGLSADVLMHKADQFMYYVKEQGGNNYYLEELSVTQ